MSSTKKVWLSIGSLCHGSLRTVDLVNALWSVLRPRWPKRLRGAHHRRLARDVAEVLRTEGASTLVDGDELIQELEGELHRYLPAFTYLGMLDGDGADFGVWPDEDDIREHTRWVSDLSEIEARWCGNVCLITDHGNRTLGYMSPRGKWTEYWSTV